MAASCRRSLIRSCFVELVETCSCRSLLAGVAYVVFLPLSSFPDGLCRTVRLSVISLGQSVIREFSSYRVMFHTCRARS